MNRKREDFEYQEQEYNRFKPVIKKIKSPTLSMEKFDANQINEELRSMNEMKLGMINNLSTQVLDIVVRSDLNIRRMFE